MLPFKIQPTPDLVTLGNPTTGTLEIPKIGDLSILEREFIRANVHVNVRKLAVELARKIIADTKGPLLDTFNALVTMNTEQLPDHIDCLLEIDEASGEAIAQTTLARATAILKFRVAPDWTIEDSKDANKIHPELLRLVAQFAENEELGWQTRQSQVETDATLGKP